jgi:pimeloyl-ACP methyl ester carboxylesterase
MPSGEEHMKALIGAVALATAYLSGVLSASAEIVVGVNLSLTGPAATLGASWQRSPAMAPKEIGGEPARYVILDDGTDPSAAVRAPAFQPTGFASSTDEELLIAARGREAEVYYGWKPFMHNPQLRSGCTESISRRLCCAARKTVSSPRTITEAYPELIPNARLTVVADAGHHVHIDNSLAFSEQIIGFIRAAGPDT